MNDATKKFLKLIFIISFFPIYLLIVVTQNDKINKKYKMVITPILIVTSVLYLRAFFTNNTNVQKSQPIATTTKITTSSQYSTIVSTVSTTAKVPTTTITTTTQKNVTSPTCKTSSTTTVTVPETVPETESIISETVPVTKQSITYWLNTDSGKYHYESCRTIKDGTTEAYWMPTTDIDWLRSNYTACKVCKP